VKLLIQRVVMCERSLSVDQLDEVMYMLLHMWNVMDCGHVK
jgi:hypothetical protein